MTHTKRSIIVGVLAGVALGCGIAIAPKPTPLPSPLPSATPTVAIAGDPCTVNGQVYCVLNPDVSFATRNSTICVSGYTRTIRPPASYTDALKVRQMAAEHLPGTTHDYEEDHRVPLEGGGAPRDEHNLAPEPIAQAHVKDSAENALKVQLCSAASEQQFRAEQAAFVQQWLAPYPGFK